MSGRKQHHIPQSVLRGFETPSKGRTKKVWVFSKEKKFKSPTADVAAERHFYSELSNDGSRTLDDLITDYEQSFGAQLTSLRCLPVGDAADSLTAAEVVAHLTIRNAHLRRSFVGGARLLAERATDLFCKRRSGQVAGHGTPGSHRAIEASWQSARPLITAMSSSRSGPSTGVLFSPLFKKPRFRTSMVQR